MKYLTVINKVTRKPVPFVFLPNGEIMITSTDPANDEDSCQLVTGDIFYEYSIDLLSAYKRV